MRIDVSPFRFPQKKRFRIHKAKSRISAPYKGNVDYRKQLDGLREEINELQKKLFAHDRYAVLAIFQAMDAAGKDSTITNVFTGVSPMSVNVHPFKKPTPEELDHDFLWRSTLKLPPRGHIGIFNRSYYEEVIICKVHPEIILNTQRLPVHATDDMKRLFRRRFDAIREFEKYLQHNGTCVIKFFLNVSNREQEARILARLDDPSKNWKFDEADITERKFWKDYMAAYEDTVRETATEHAPWYVIPADDKKTMRLLVAEALLTEMRRLKLTWPELPTEHRAAIERSRKKLAEDLK